jgi:uncharacterized protein with NAD-binding domain and iron-sulfur cluster
MEYFCYRSMLGNSVTDERRTKVAIIGGGCAAMAAAFELTRREHGGRYEVTVYQQGWRLGGKGASGRGPAGRIEEHGLHVWMGWYENAFRLMRECYAELGRDPAVCPIADWRDAFVPDSLVGVTDHAGDGHWRPWVEALPPNEEQPGDPSGRRPFTVERYMARSAALVRTLLVSLGAASGGNHVSPPSRAAVTDGIARLLRSGGHATLAGLAQGARLVEAVVAAPDGYPNDVALRFVDALARSASGLLEERLEGDHRLRRVWEVLDLTLATLRGEMRFGVWRDPRGFDALDDYECREWLLLNGASPRALDSGFMRALYDLGFSYEDGDPGRPRISAGQALRGTVRSFFTYRGAFFWRMQAGMGDVVFAPLYEVLRRRGVRFAFFHRLENVRLAGGATGEPHVGALDMDVQADVIGGREYEPLVDVGGLPCWPSRPDWRQLADGARLEHEGQEFESFWDRRRIRSRTLEVGRDFDLVVLAVGLGAIPHVGRELVARDPRWRAMVDHVKTVATQAFQVWLSADMPALGWGHPPMVLSGFRKPFETMADMRHLLRHERWEQPPRALVYFCSALADPGLPLDDVRYPAVQREQVRRNAVRFLEAEIGRLWPDAASDGGEFRWELLCDPAARHDTGGSARFASQYWTANVNPSDRYTLSLPGSGQYRISPLDRSYDNLTIAGDWTDCGFNAGCVEAAVMSGLLAAHAVSGAPTLETIVGYDHP